MVYTTDTSSPRHKTINLHDAYSMGINPVGLDYCRVEDIIQDIGPQLQRPHRHEYYEIIWFTHGRGSHMVEFAHYELQPNTLFFFPRNQIHSFLTVAGLKGHMLRFDESFIKKITDQDVSFIDYSLFKIHSSPIRYLPDRKAALFETLMSLIKNELEKPEQVHHLEMLTALLTALLVESERILPPQDHLLGVDKNILKKFHRFTTLLEDNFHKHYSVGRYAEMMHMAPKTLRTICKEISGQPAKAIIQDRVVLEAKLYLEKTTLDIQEISYKLGFEDPSYFSRYFKRAVKTAPSAFRAKRSSNKR